MNSIKIYGIATPACGLVRNDTSIVGFRAGNARPQGLCALIGPTSASKIDRSGRTGSSAPTILSQLSEGLKRKERDFTASLSFSYRAKLLCFNRNDFTTVVVAASLARSVRQAGLAALRASDDAGDRQFPVGAASLISSRAGYFSLGYCHAVHLLGLNASRHIVYILSRSCCKAANLGSGSGLQLQGPRLRLAPQRKHRPLQSGLQSS